MLLFDRYYTINAAGDYFTIDELDAEFIVENSNDNNAGTAEVVIYNLSKQTRDRIKKDEPLKIEAGYRDSYGVIFYGTIDEVITQYDRADVKLVIKATDKLNQLWKNKRISKTYPKDSAVEQAVKDMFLEAGIPIGKVENTGITFKTDFTLIGTPYENLETLTRYVNGEVEKNHIYIDAWARREIENKEFYTYYYKNGPGYFVKKNYKDAVAFLLKSETGLLEVQKAESDDYDYKVRSLLYWQIRQDSLIQLESVVVSGLFKVINYKHSGDRGESCLNLIEKIKSCFK